MAGLLRRILRQPGRFAGLVRRSLPQIALFGGLALFGITLIILGVEGAGEGTRELHPASLTVVNESALLVYPVDYRGYSYSRVDVGYAFPQAAGNTYFVGCEDLDAMLQGGDPASPVLAFVNLREGEFVVSDQTVRSRAFLRTTVDTAEGEERRYCSPALVFRWAAPEADPALNRPTVNATYYGARFQGEDLVPLLVMLVLAPTLSIAGGLAWARQRTRWKEEPLASEDSTVEVLRRALDRMGEQLERTRRHLLFAGVLGIFLWYPILVPWAWRQVAQATDDSIAPFVVAALVAGFLAVLTVLWAREFLRLDAELEAWRRRMRALRERETGLMDALELHGG